MIPTLDKLKEYLGLLQEFPDVVDIHKGALSKVRDCERMKEEGRIDVRTSMRERMSVRLLWGQVDKMERERGRENERLM